MASMLWPYIAARPAAMIAKDACFAGLAMLSAQWWRRNDAQCWLAMTIRENTVYCTRMYGPCIWRQYIAIQAWRKAKRNSPDLHPLRDQNIPPLADLIRVWPEIKCSEKVSGTAHRIVYFIESIKCMEEINKYTRAVEYREVYTSIIIRIINTVETL